MLILTALMGMSWYCQASLPLQFGTIAMISSGVDDTASTVGVSIQGGTPPYKYFINGRLQKEDYTQSTFFMGLAPKDQYQIVVVDSQGSSIDARITLENSGLLVESQIAPERTPSVLPNKSFAVPPYEGGKTIIYALNKEGKYAPISSLPRVERPEVPDPLSYAKLVRAPAVITFEADIVPTSCFDSSNGQITVTSITGGTPPYQISVDGSPFQIFNPKEGAVFSHLDGGGHFITIVDVRAYRTSKPVTIKAPRCLDAVIAHVVNVKNNGESNGSFTLENITGGTAPYSFSFKGEPFKVFDPAAGVTFSHLAAGTYMLIVQDSKENMLEIPVTITQQTQFVITLVGVTPVSSPGAVDGRILAVVTPGFTGVHYSIDGVRPPQSSPEFTGLSAGTYTVRAEVGGLGAVATAVVAKPTKKTKKGNASSKNNKPRILKR